MDDIIKSFLCVTVMRMSVLMYAYVSINISQHKRMDFIKVFVTVLANVRHPQEGCDTKQ